MKYSIKDVNSNIKIIGLYQIIGGILGVGLTARIMLHTSDIGGALMMIFLAALFLFYHTIKAGIVILQKSRRKEGVLYSMIMQGFQIIGIGIGKYSYEFFSGAKLTIGFSSGEGSLIEFGAALSGFNFSINSGEPEYFLYFNILAIVILYVLTRIYRALESVTKEIEVE